MEDGEVRLQSRVTASPESKYALRKRGQSTEPQVSLEGATRECPTGGTIKEMSWKAIIE